MKNCKAFFCCALTLLSSFILISCAEEEEVIPSSEVVESVSSFLLSEDGLVLTRLTDEGEEEGSYFTSYVFQFGENGRVVATASENTVEGTYSLSQDESRTELQMSFPTISNFDELNDDWYLLSIEQNSITFEDDGDLLVFEQQ